MRHIIAHDTERGGWLVIDTESANMVVSVHASPGAASRAAEAEERDWPARRPSAR